VSEALGPVQDAEPTDHSAADHGDRGRPNRESISPDRGQLIERIKTLTAALESARPIVKAHLCSGCGSVHADMVLDQIEAALSPTTPPTS